MIATRLRYLPLLALLGCTTPQTPPAAPADAFLAGLKTLCGRTVSGRLVTSDPADAAFAGKALVARSVGCTDDEVRIAFDVGEDRSRTWIVTRTATGLRLKHRHLLKDGSVDPVSNYGGDTVAAGTAQRQEFPVDAESRAMFAREGRSVSNTNVWAFEIAPGAALTYELARPAESGKPGRLFRVTFDLSKSQH